MVRSVKSLPTRKRTARRKVTGSSASCDRIPKLIRKPLPTKKTKERKATSKNAEESETSNVNRKPLPTKKTNERKATSTNAEESETSNLLRKPLPTKKTKRRKATSTNAEESETSNLLRKHLQTKKTKKRTATSTNAEESETSNLVSASSSSTRRNSRRKIHRPEYLSDHHIYSEDETDEEEENANSSVLLNDEVKCFSSSKWSSVDLSPFNVEYEKKPVSLEVMLENLKEKFTDITVSEKIDPTEVIEKAKEFLKENLPFSIKLRKLAYGTNFQKTLVKARYLEDLSEIQKKLTRTEFSTLSKFHQLVGLMPYLDFTREVKSLVLSCTKGKSVSRICSEKMLQDICEKFMELFFLRKSNMELKTYYYKKKTVRSFPDITYAYKYGIADQKNKLFFVTEVKSTQMPCLYEGETEEDQPMERKVGVDVMGQIGSELLLQGSDSVFYPDSLAVACMETKLIFVHLRRSIEHYQSIMDKEKQCPIPEKAVITHTESYDMLIEEDRMKMAELLFWLGCVQDRLRYRYLSYD